MAPERLMLFDPSAKVREPPPQEPVSPSGVDTTSPEGSVSVKATPVNALTVFGFVMAKVRLVLALSGVCEEPNAMVRVGGVVADCAKAVPIGHTTAVNSKARER